MSPKPVYTSLPSLFILEPAKVEQLYGVEYNRHFQWSFLYQRATIYKVIHPPFPALSVERQLRAWFGEQNLFDASVTDIRGADWDKVNIRGPWVGARWMSPKKIIRRILDFLYFLLWNQ